MKGPAACARPRIFKLAAVADLLVLSLAQGTDNLRVMGFTEKKEKNLTNADWGVA